MAAFNVLSLSLSFKEPISNPYFSASSNPIRTFSNSNRAQTSPSSISARSNFTWDDVLHISHLHDDPSDLRPYFAKIRLCNQGSELQSEFVPFVVEDQIAGYVHNGFLDHLRKFHDVFAFSTEKTSKNLSNGYVMLHPSLKSPDDRTRAVGDVIKLLGEVLVPALSCNVIIWDARIFLTRTCSSSILWHKGCQSLKKLDRNPMKLLFMGTGQEAIWYVMEKPTA